MSRVGELVRFILPIIVLSACTTLSDQDRALLTSANKNADEAKAIAQRALDAARSAQASAAASASDAKAANEKADEMLQRSLRKVSPSSEHAAAPLVAVDRTSMVSLKY